MMAINQASVLVGDLRSLKMWDNKTSARINPRDGKKCTSSQLKFIKISPGYYRKREPPDLTANVQPRTRAVLSKMDFFTDTGLISIP
jgi:hypothetical protein